jgi:hypothetical protein
MTSNTISLPPDTKLEAELQELYIEATHWLQDISFLETETQFFRHILNRYHPVDTRNDQTLQFLSMIKAQESRFDALKIKIPGFLVFLEPFIGDLKRAIDLSFLEKYNSLSDELQQLFADVRRTKAELFKYTESIMAPAGTETSQLVRG